MQVDSVTRRLFTTTLAKWAKALESGDLEGARFQLEQLKSAGQMMAIHPDFQRAMSQQRSPQPIESSTEVLRVFLAAATEMHAIPAGKA